MAILEVNNIKKIYTTRFGANKVQALSLIHILSNVPQTEVRKDRAW